MNSVSRQCILFGSNECDENCDECDRCDLDPRKICDNCMKCVKADADYRGVLIEGIRLTPGEQD